MSTTLLIRRATIPVVLIALLLGGSVAQGAIVVVRYVGYVTELDNASSGFPLAVGLDDPFELGYQIDTEVSDSLPDDPSNGRFENAIVGWSARIGNQVFAWAGLLNNVTQTFGNVIAVTRDGAIPNYGVLSGDAYQIGSSAYLPGGIVVQGELSLRNHYPGNPLVPFSTDVLFPGPVNLDAWDHRSLALSFWDAQTGGRTIFGVAETAELTIVPIPATAVLFATALAWLRTVRRQ